MFEKVLHHRLLADGGQGQGVVTKRTDEASQGGEHHIYAYIFALKGHITFPDGTQTEWKSSWLNSANVGDIEEGAIVPVRFDREDHSKVVLDVTELERGTAERHAHHQHALDHDKARAIANADARAAAANRELHG